VPRSKSASQGFLTAFGMTPDSLCLNWFLNKMEATDE